MLSIDSYINKANEYRLFVISISKTMKDSDYSGSTLIGYSEKFVNLQNNLRLCLLNSCKVILLKHNIDFKNEKIDDIINYTKLNYDKNGNIRDIIDKNNYFQFFVSINDIEKSKGILDIIIINLNNFIYSLSDLK